MPVKIHGKDYVTVAERVAAFHEALNGEARIQTEIVGEDEQSVTVRATVWTTTYSSFMGHARSNKADKSIEGSSPLEVAETSAVGRALGFAGFGAVEGIATADEVKAAPPTRTSPDAYERTGRKPAPTSHQAKPATRTVEQPAAYKGNWSKFWVLAKEKGLSKDDVHAYFGVETSMTALAEARAAAQAHSLQDEIDALTDALRARA